MVAVPVAESARSIDVPAMLKEAGITALIVLALTFTLVGFEVADVPGGLEIRTRFGDVAVAVLIAFFTRIGLILLRRGRPMPVLAVGTPLVALMLLLLLGEFLFGPETAAALSAFIPFNSPIVLWAVVIGVSFLIGRAAYGLRKQTIAAEVADERARLRQIQFRKFARYFGPLILAAAILFPFTEAADRRLLDITILVLTYVMLGWGLNIVVGLAGLLDLGYVAFYAVGAYSFALLATNFDVSFWGALPFAGAMAALAGVLLGFPVLRLRGDYLAIVTLGFGEIIRIILQNWYEVTKGPDGISGIPRPSFFGIADFTRDAGDGMTAFHELFGLEYSPIQRIIFLYYLILALALVVNIFTMRVRRLPVGRAWEALREDETASISLGINPRNTKLTAFGIGAMFAGFAGSFFATRQGFISPESFTFIESAVILAIVVLGGFGSQIGVVIAAVVLIGLPEFFRELSEYRLLAFGFAMVLIMLWRPEGLISYREPTIKLPTGGHKEAGQ